ncbi:LssY C-terminal domain-containing protein [soil metagenome]
MSLDELKPFMLWMHVHPQWSGLAVFAIVLAESLAIIGLFFPGIMIMIAIGILIGSGVLPIISTLLWILLGALCGDFISYWLGYHYRNYILEMWPFRLFPTLIIKGEKFFQSHGGKSVFLGRFLGPIRPTIPMIAGMLNMPTLRFVLVDTISTIVWALIYMAPGILIGFASQALAPELATRIILFLVISLLALCLVSWAIKRFFSQCKYYFNIWLHSLWAKMQQQPRLLPLYDFLKNPRQPEDHHQLTLALLFVVGLIGFLFLIISVHYEGILTSLNLPLFHFMRSLYHPDLEKIMVAVTFLCEGPVILVFFTGVLLFLFWSRYWYTAGHWLILGLLAMGSRGIIKRIMAVPRPGGLIHSPSGWSFPSGHSTLAMAFFGFLAILLANNLSPPIRRMCYGVAAILIGLVMFSRIYLGAHWLTDVIGGALLGWLIVLALTISYRRLLAPSPNSVNLFAAALITLVIAYSGYFIHNFKIAVHNYTPYWPTHSLDAATWWQTDKQKVPLTYLENRFGKLVQTVNVEWAGPLTDIKHSLETAGWKVETTSLVTSTVNYMNTKDKSQILPPTLLLYHGQKPVLIMTKTIAGEFPRLLVLHLWDSHLQMYNTNLPLWVGNIHYHRPKKHAHHATKIPLPATAPAAIDSLIASIAPAKFEWQTLTIANSAPRNHKEDADWDGRVLLIKIKAVSS